MRIALAAARPVDGVRAEIAAERYANAAERTQLRTQLLAALRDARERGVKLEPRPVPIRSWRAGSSWVRSQPGAMRLADR